MKMMEVVRLMREWRKYGSSYADLADLFETDVETARRLVGKDYRHIHKAKFLNPIEAARLLGCGVKRIRNLVRRGELTASNISSHPNHPRTIISRESLAEFLKRREVKPPQPPVRRRRDTKKPAQQEWY